MRNVENIWNIHDADSAAVWAEDPAAYLWKDQNPGKETLHKLVRIPQYLQPPNPPLSHHTNGAKITFTANCPFIWNPEVKIKSTKFAPSHNENIYSFPAFWGGSTQYSKYTSDQQNS